MPNCTGIDLLKRVRSSEQYKSIPFIMLTAEGEAHNILDAKKAGVTDYVVKPFDVAELMSRFEVYVFGKK